MRLASFPLPSVAVLLFDFFEPPQSITARQLPFYVEPAAEEALISWLLRLASRLQISMRRLLQGAFQIDPRAEDWQAGHYPTPGFLQRMSHRTGVGLRRLQSMIFDAWAPFGCQAKDQLVPRSTTAHSLAVCGRCLAEDPHPYLRLSWMIDWMGVCSRHPVILFTHCPQCRAKVRLPSQTAHAFSPGCCIRCGIALTDAKTTTAGPAVIDLQSRLLTGKRQGMTQIKGLGRLSWSEIVALAEVLFDLWAIVGIPERYFLLQQPEFHGIHHGSHRYRNLALLAALLRGWPYSATAQIVKHTLVKCLARSDPSAHPEGWHSCTALQGEVWSWDERRQMHHKLLGISAKPTHQTPPASESMNKDQSTNKERQSRN